MIYDDLTVYVRDGWSKVVRMPEPGIVGAVRRGKTWEAIWSDPPADPSEEGWIPVLRGTGSRTEGWAYAAIHHGALPIDYDNRLKARPISDACPLYRAVSIPEMADILKTGAVGGGGNGFHDFDDRPFVFFADTITPKVIWQGEEIERSLGHPIRLRASELEVAYDGYLEELEYEARKNLQAAFRTGDDEVLLKLSTLSTPLDWGSIRDPNSRAFRDAIWLGIVPEQEVSRILREFRQEREALTAEFKSDYRRMHEERQREREAMSFTSAVIETRPIGLGFHFSEAFGRSGMGNEDEYGLFPGQVRAEDIASVRWVKDGSIVHASSYSEAADVIALLDQERSKVHSEELSLPTP